eukprot:CAMPEP_0176091978 /NCGR_PEP_ID=MMETSP0120_2-20121206/46075_1 /TAXON_ID=160619 /ORGANISM="Kryptoperidinium foliaceum, Strain CCMP 1326" /LENGTH=225 /DNA_ID=CAMNT_0017425883 /DNA_START=15 /DNA_END=692 /DNA_ORIENTATION=+
MPDTVSALLESQQMAADFAALKKQFARMWAAMFAVAIFFATAILFDTEPATAIQRDAASQSWKNGDALDGASPVAWPPRGPAGSDVQGNPAVRPSASRMLVSVVPGALLVAVGLVVGFAVSHVREAEKARERHQKELEEQLIVARKDRDAALARDSKIEAAQTEAEAGREADTEELPSGAAQTGESSRHLDGLNGTERDAAWKAAEVEREADTEESSVAAMQNDE